jgi:hypothetical protein
MTTSFHPAGLGVEEKQRYQRVCAVSDSLEASLYPNSVSVCGPLTFAMTRKGLVKTLLVLSKSESGASEFVGTRRPVALADSIQSVSVCPLNHQNAVALRKHLPFTAPAKLGRGPSIGMGDRLGLATPGHVLAIQGGPMRPALAQQSIREMERSLRRVTDVLDDATWGVLQAGYRDGFAADADHLKTTGDIDACLSAGFTMFTVDPSHHLDASADTAELGQVEQWFSALPWDALHSSPSDCLSAYADRTFAVEGEGGGFPLVLTGRELLRAAVKYGRAIAHAVNLYEYLATRVPRDTVEFEISVDETDTVTSLAEHLYVAAELRRLGVRCDSLAVHFPGRFLKGVDYVGSVQQFRAEFARHVLIAQHFGPYKLSLHSGSDKFSIYPIVAELGGELVHVKTAGTSYLEALRVVAQVAPDLFREILAFACQRYPEDRASYHVDGAVAKVPEPAALRDRELPEVLNQDDARQVCHVTFGSVLTGRGPDGDYLFRDRLLSTLRAEEELYHTLLRDHFRRHLSPFT